MKKLLKVRTMALLLALAPLTQMNGQCLTAIYGAYPTAAYTPSACDGLQNYIVSDAYAGEYSNVNVTTGQVYKFSSDITTDYVTISNAAGTTAYANGVGTVTWTSTITGVVRFYLHTNATCGDDDTERSRIVVCGVLPTCPSPTATVPYNMSFESGENFTCVTVENVNGATTWGYFNNGTAQTASTGTRSIRYAWNATTPGNDWFYTPGLSLTGGTAYTLKFSYKASDGPTYVENLEVKYGTAANAAAMTSAPIVTLAGINSALASPFAVSTTNFTPATSGTYYLGFRNYSAADQAFLYIDDISVTAALSTDDLTSKTLKYFPNPVKDVFNLSHTENIDGVSVFNLLGQQVLSASINGTEGSVNMSSLPAGNYIVKVNAGNTTSNIKILKQ